MRRLLLGILLLHLSGTCIAQDVIELADETSFRNVDFSQENYALIPTWGEASEAFGIEPWDYYIKRYQFADAVLTRQGFGTEGIVTSIVPGHPVSEEEALDYGLVLSCGQMPELVSRDGQAIVREVVTESGAGCRLTLMLDEAGMVTEIRFSEWSP